MSEQHESRLSKGCEFCIDAPEAEFDFCRVCGRGANGIVDFEPPIIEPMTGLRLAVRMAKGGPLGSDTEQDVLAYLRGTQTDEGRKIASRMRWVPHV